MILFVDLDGTLADSLPLLWKGYCSFMERFALQPTREEFESLNGPSLREVVGILQARYRFPGDADALSDEYHKQVQQQYQGGLQLFPGVTECLAAAAKRDIRMAVVTSQVKAPAEAFLSQAGILDYFEAVVTADGLANSKPHPAIYRRALEVMGAQPHEAVAVEDSSNGIRAACAAGIPVIWMRHGRDQQDHDGLVAQVDSWAQMQQWLTTAGD